MHSISIFILVTILSLVKGQEIPLPTADGKVEILQFNQTVVANEEQERALNVKPVRHDVPVKVQISAIVDDTNKTITEIKDSQSELLVGESKEPIGVKGRAQGDENDISKKTATMLQKYNYTCISPCFFYRRLDGTNGSLCFDDVAGREFKYLNGTVAPICPRDSVCSGSFGLRSNIQTATIMALALPTILGFIKINRMFLL